MSVIIIHPLLLPLMETLNLPNHTLLLLLFIFLYHTPSSYKNHTSAIHFSHQTTTSYYFHQFLYTTLLPPIKTMHLQQPLELGSWYILEFLPRLASGAYVNQHLTDV